MERGPPSPQQPRKDDQFTPQPEVFFTFDGELRVETRAPFAVE